MKVLCQCGHPQVLHMGPTGSCRVLPVREVDKRGRPIGKPCSCSSFVPAPELERKDLA